jgi:hypothetical protein
VANRVIRGDINVSRSLERVSMLADLTFRALILAVDEYGRTDARLHVLRALIFPTRPEVTDKKLDGWLAELEREGCIRRYVVDGGAYLCLPKWEKHRGKQRRPEHSRYPAPSEEILGNPRKAQEIRSGDGVGDGDGDGVGGTLGVHARSARPKTKGKSPPPADLEPSEHEALEVWCRETLSRPDLVPRLQSLVAACLDFHRAKGNAMASWYAAVQTWVRNEADGRFGRPAAAIGTVRFGAPPSVEQIREAFERQGGKR